jgi:hypothetical protein
LFHPNVGGQRLRWNTITPVQAALAIRNCLMTGEVDWEAIVTEDQYCD